MALARKVAINTIIQVATKITTTGLSLIALALITRHLGRYGFGQYTTAVSWVMFFSIAADLGITLVTSQLLSKPGADVTSVMSNLFTFRLLSGFIIIALAPIVIFFSPYELVVKQGASPAALAFYFVIITQVFVSFFQKELRTDRIAIAEVISRIVFLLLTFWAVRMEFGVVALLWVLAVVNGISFFIHYFYARRAVSFGWRYDKAVWCDIIKRSWPLVITIVLNLVYLKADILILSLFRSQAEVGLYGAAYRVIDALVTVPFLIGGTVLPILAARWHLADKSDFKRIWQRVFDVSAIIAWPVMIGGYILATPIMSLISGSDFAAAGPILKILILGVGCIFFSCFFGYTMISLDRQRALIKAYVITALTSLVLYIILIPLYSYVAAAWITVYSELLMSILAWLILRKNVQLKINFTRFFKALLAGGIMGLLLMFPIFSTETVLGLLLTVILGGLVYCVILYALKGVVKDDVVELLQS